MESWSQRMIQYASNGYEYTKEKVSNGVEKLKDPEFQNKVKEKVGNAVKKTKEVIYLFFK